MVQYQHWRENAQSGWRRFRSQAVWLQLLAVVIVLGLFYWLFHAGNGGDRGRRPQAPIAIAPVTHKDIPVYLDGLGTVQAFNTVTVHTQVDGQLTEVLFDEGQEVKKGDVLAKIDPRVFQAQFDQATATKAKDEASLANARRDLQRYQNLGNSVSAQTVDTQRATVQQLEATVKGDQAAIDSAATQLSYTTITAPIDGRTGIRQVDAGNIVHPGDANGLVVITQLHPITVLFSLPQQNLEAINAQMANGDKLPVLAVASDGKTVLDTGELALVDNQIDQSTGTIKLKSTFSNDKNNLWPGGFVNVRLLLTTRKDALVVPTVSVQRGPQGAYVFAYNAGNSTVSMKPVKVAMSEGQDTVIDEGVAEGDQVVTDGMAKLQEGSKVTLSEQAKARQDEKPADAAAGAEKPADKPADGSEKHHHKHEG